MADPGTRQPPRWGVRAMGFLGLAILSIIVSTDMGHYGLWTFTGLVAGVIGAGVCSVIGLIQWQRWLRSRRWTGPRD